LELGVRGGAGTERIDRGERWILRSLHFVALPADIPGWKKNDAFPNAYFNQKMVKTDRNFSHFNKNQSDENFDDAKR